MRTIQEKKLNSYYKSTSTEKAVKDVDLSTRTVSGVFNSYFYIDSDLDMLLPGCAKKSIEERGVNSTKGNRIKHLKDHDWSKNIARLDVLDEREVDINGRKMQGIYHESFYPESTDSTDMLIKIQEGLYDARSIGFVYKQLVGCVKDSDDRELRDNYSKYIQMAINPEVAEEAGGCFYVVKEIMLFEGSDVSFGANQLTPLLGVKGTDKNILATKLNNKIDICHKLFKSGNLSDEGFHKLDMEIKQIKEYIANITDSKPSIKKDTSLLSSRRVNDTSNEKEKFFKGLIKS